MKLIAPFLLLLTVCSCGVSNIPTPRNRISLELRDSQMLDSYLLSVREQSVVVAPYTKEEVSNNELIVNARTVPITDITRVYEIYGPAFRGMPAWPAIVGSVLGFGIGGFTDLGRAFGHSTPTDGFKPGQLTLYWTIGGLLSGFTLGYLFNTAESEYPIDTKANFQKLKEHAIYPTEEPVSLREIE